jgi:hypothetical protein
MFGLHWSLVDSPSRRMFIDHRIWAVDWMYIMYPIPLVEDDLG